MIYQGTAYDYNQRGEILIPTRSGTTYYNPQNYRSFVVYKNLAQNLEFFVKDSNRKPVNLDSKTLTATVVDRISKSVVITKTLVPADYDNGVAVMRITQSDTSLLSIGLYDIIITYTEVNGEVFGLFSDQNSRISFVLEIKNNPLPAARPSLTTSTFTLIDDKNYTQRFASTAQTGNTDGTNTLTAYTTNYTGELYAQGSLDTNPTETDWFLINLSTSSTGHTFTNSSGITSFTFEGLFVWTRFYHIPDSNNLGSLDKISYRS